MQFIKPLNKTIIHYGIIKNICYAICGQTTNKLMYHKNKFKSHPGACKRCLAELAKKGK